MSDATLNGEALDFCELVRPLYGVWFADVRLTDAIDLTGSVELVLGGATFRGTVKGGGVFEGQASYRIVGGQGTWGRVLPATSYRDDGGVRLSQVLFDLATETGEDLVRPADRSLGTAYVRREGPASRTLAEVTGGLWYVGDDGVTRAEERVLAAAPSGYEVLDVDTRRGKEIIAAESIVGMRPGQAFTHTALARTLVHRLDRSKIRTEVWASSVMPDAALNAAIREVFPRVDYFGFYQYEVASQSGNEVSIRALTAECPDVRSVRMRPGLAGSTSTLAVGSGVLVGFENGDPREPYIAFYQDADRGGFVPVNTSIDASTSLTLGASASAVYVGTALSAVPVAKAPPLTTWATTVTTAIAQIAALLNVPGMVIGAPGSVTPAAPLAAVGTAVLKAN